MAKVVYDRRTGEYYATGDTGQELYAFWRGYALWATELEFELETEYGIYRTKKGS